MAQLNASETDFQPGLQWINPCLSLISLEGGTQSRITEKTSQINEYGKLMAQGNWDWHHPQSQPITLFWDKTNQTLWCGDGHHRIKAARREAIKQIYVEIRIGSLSHAQIFNCTSNSSHGIRPTRSDKRQQILILLKAIAQLPLAEQSQWSHREIARQIGVDHKTVGRVRQLLEQGEFNNENSESRYNESVRKQKRNAKRLVQVTNELGVEELIHVLQTLNPSKVSKLKQAVHYLEAS